VSTWPNSFNADDEGSMFPWNVGVNVEAHSIKTFTLHTGFVEQAHYSTLFIAHVERIC
jgi:hypothetical protein